MPDQQSATMNPSGGLLMGRVWPANRGKPSSSEHLVGQRLKLTCGVEGCRKSFQGEFVTVLAKRDAHRALAHPDFVAPPRKRRFVRSR